MPGEGAKVSAGEMELSPTNLAEKEPLNPGEDKTFFNSFLTII